MKTSYGIILFVILWLSACKSIAEKNKSSQAEQPQTIASSTGTPRYNILFIAVDDLKPLLSNYGHPEMHTPNFDRLADMGVTFTSAYVQQAVCGPSRASVMTATRPDRTKVWDLHTDFRQSAPDLISMPEYLIRQGYKTLAIGKIYHMGSASPGHDAKSWSIPYLRPNNFNEKYGKPAYSDYQSSQNKQIFDSLTKIGIAKQLKRRKLRKFVLRKWRPSTECIDVPDDAYKDGMATKNVLKVLDTLQTDRPFFLAVGYHRPHLPFIAPKKYWDLYNRENIQTAAFQQLSEGTPRLAYHNFGELRAYSDISDTLRVGDRLPVEKQKELIHGYMASISYIDAQIGKLIDKLQAKDLLKNTIIVLWGDHGYHLGDHTEWCKHSNFEQATRIPLMLVAPGLPGNLKIDQPVELLDLFPTLFELNHISIPQQAEGKSLVQLIRNPASEAFDNNFAVSQFHRGKDKDIEGYSIRTKRYRYTEWHKNHYKSFKSYDESNLIAVELYDYEKDSLETRNWVADPAYATVLSRMKTRLKSFLQAQEKAANLRKKNRKKALVFLLAGQSNMDGRARGYKLTDEDRRRLEKAQKNVVLYYNHQLPRPLSLTKAKPYLKKKFNTETIFGPELFFGINMAEKYPDRQIILIKRSLGGMSLYGAWNPNWSIEKARLMHEENKPRLYEDFVSYTKEILSQMKPDEYELAGMLWVQGETDSAINKFGKKPADTYYENLKKLIVSVRKEFQKDDLPFLIFQVGSGKVVQAMKSLAKEDPYTVLIPQEKNQDSKYHFHRNPPPVGHYTYESMKRIGRYFYEFYIDNFEKK